MLFAPFHLFLLRIRPLLGAHPYMIWRGSCGSWNKWLRDGLFSTIFFQPLPPTTPTLENSRSIPANFYLLRHLQKPRLPEVQSGLRFPMNSGVWAKSERVGFLLYGQSLENASRKRLSLGWIDRDLLLYGSFKWYLLRKPLPVPLSGQMGGTLRKWCQKHDLRTWSHRMRLTLVCIFVTCKVKL